MYNVSGCCFFFWIVCMPNPGEIKYTIHQLSDEYYNGCVSIVKVNAVTIMRLHDKEARKRRVLKLFLFVHYYHSYQHENEKKNKFPSFSSLLLHFFSYILIYNNKYQLSNMFGSKKRSHTHYDIDITTCAVNVPTNISE